MEEDLAGYEFSPITDVEYEFKNTFTDSNILKKYTRCISKARSVYELNEMIIKAIHKLDSLQSFKSCDVKVFPGKGTDSALVSFILQDNNWWNMSIGASASNEGGKTEASATLRNLRSKADQTIVKVEYKPNTRTYGYQFLHHDKLYIPGKWEAIYSFKEGGEELDINLKENNYSGSFILKSFDGTNKIEIGRSVRTNSVRVENSSLKLICDALPVNSKNYLSYTFIKDSRDNHQFPKSGNLLTLTNEFAYGNDNKFHKIDFKLNTYFGLTSALVFQTSIAGGFILPWKYSKVSINDRYRLRFVKGFNYIGTRAIAADPYAASKYLINGDNIGKSSNLNLEGKLHFYNFPGLHDMGLVPFIYGNVLCEEPTKLTSLKNYCRENVRASAGFGFGWNASFGRIEFVYATRVLQKTGDLASEFQVLFSD